MKKWKLGLNVIAISLLMSTHVFAANVVNLFVNGEHIETSVSSKIENGRTLVPLRAIAEALGAEVSWNQENQTIKLAEDSKNIELKIGKKTALVNGESVSLEIAPKVESGTTLVPVRFVAENLDSDVKWNEKESAVNINDSMPIGKADLDYATKFEIEYLGNGNKKIKDSLEQEFLLVPNGNQIPDGYENLKVIRTPMKNVMAGSTTQVSMLNALGSMDVVTGVTNPAEVWTIEEMKNKILEGKVSNVGNGMSINFESLELLKPELILMTSAWDDKAKYDELGYKYIGCFDYEENRAFGRLETVKFWGALLNKDKAAMKYYDEQVEKLEHLKQRIDGIENRKKIAWGAYSTYSKTYNIAPGESYVAEMIDLAGGDYLGKAITKDQKNVSAEEYYLKFKDAEIMISSSMPQYGGPDSIKSLVEETPLLENAKFVKENNAWYQAPNFYQDLAHTYDYIEDLAMMFYPELFETQDINHFVKMKK
ncbi:MAG: stalk domain-containing protein [Tissierellales bacterium]|jgi:iron complex transport system substrate-binding protein|nr:stalk domain-containing protein [Tissierellales bacterium]